MTNNSWEEIDQVDEDGRFELHLNGDVISEKLRRSDGDLPVHLFDLTSLNYLEISDTTLSTIPNEIGKLANLLNLALHRNKIDFLPDTVSNLAKLKFMDISYNNLESLPDSFCIQTLHTLNLSNNQLKTLPDFSGLSSLSILFIDHNKLISLPEGLEKSNISDIHAASNEITTFPESVKDMHNLKHMDISENLLKEVACDLSECRKLKTLDLKANPLKDNRLRKMTLQCSTKSILEYLAKQQSSGGGGKKKGKGKKGKGEKKENNDNDPLARKIFIVKPNDKYRVCMNMNVKDTRPYICCSVVKNLDLSDAAMFKAFITLQTKLHETICDMRTRATIATHSFDELKFPLQYEALPPSAIHIVPLNKSEKVDASRLITNLKADRDNLKQQKKRQHKTGLYRFIDLVDGKEKLSCLRDCNGDVISLPPITNSEITKVSTKVSDVFIEITSPMSLPDCKFVMEELIKEMFKLGMNSESYDEMNGLVLQPIRVFDENEDLKVIYPSKIDLNIGSIDVIRLET